MYVGIRCVCVVFRICPGCDRRLTIEEQIKQRAQGVRPGLMASTAVSGSLPAGYFREASFRLFLVLLRFRFGLAPPVLFDA